MEPEIITDSGETDEAATETPPAAEDTEQPKDTFEPDELRELMRGVVQEENGKFWAAVEQSTGRHIGALRTQLEEVMGNSRRTDAMVQRMFDGQMTDADRADLDAAMGLEAEKEKLAKTEARAAAAETALQSNDGGRAAVWEHVLDHIGRVGAAEGITDATTLQRLMPAEAKPNGKDRFGFAGVQIEWEANIRAEVDRRSKAGVRKPVVATERGGGARDGATAYREALRSGGKLPSAAEIDRLTAGYAAGG